MNKLKISRINETLDSLQYLYELSKSERHFIFNASKTNQEVVELLFFILVSRRTLPPSGGR